jgi:hypothetical protein
MASRTGVETGTGLSCFQQERRRSVSAELPTFAEIVATDDEIRRVSKEVNPESSPHPLDISVRRGKLRFRVVVWEEGANYIDAETDELATLVDELKSKLIARDPAKELREKAAKLGFELVKKGGVE